MVFIPLGLEVLIPVPLISCSEYVRDLREENEEGVLISFFLSNIFLGNFIETNRENINFVCFTIQVNKWIQISADIQISVYLGADIWVFLVLHVVT